MTDEFCPRLFAKFIISLLLWQLGHEFKFQTTALSTDDPQLPPEEETALKSVADSLGLELPNKYCADVEIFCDCSYNNSTTCHITTLSWQSKRLNGYLSEAVVNLTHLEKLDLSYNQIQGSIPAILGNMSRLYSLDLSNNQLTGLIPSSLGNLKAQVFNNHLYSRRLMYQGGDRKGTNTAPCNSKAKNACQQSPPCPYFNLELSNNHLEGSIPDTLGSIKVDLTNIKGKKLEQDKTCDFFSISLHDNHLTGSIPKTFGKLNFLTTLDLRNNLLTGAIPPSLGDLSLLGSLHLSENLLNGSLPSELGKLTLLRDLFLQSNFFDGHLPETFAQLKNLWSFSISGNYLSGPFPNFITSWTYIGVLSLYGNNFRGNITPEIFNLSSLNTLEISDVETLSFRFPPSAELKQITTL